MKICSLLTLFVFIGCTLRAQFPGMNFPPGKKVKTVIGRGYNEDRNDTVNVFIESYDEKGNLLSHSEPLNYCGVTNTYDPQNRLIQKELMCGESSGNGTYSYTYTGDTEIETFLGVIWDSKITRTFENGRIKEALFLQNSPDSADNNAFKTVSTTRYSYILNAKGLLQEEQIVETIIHQDFGGAVSYNDTTIRKTVIEYTYTAFDSLETKVKKTPEGLIESEGFQYDEKLHLRKSAGHSIENPAIYPRIPNERHEVYTYDETGHLLLHTISYTGPEGAAGKREEHYHDGLLVLSTDDFFYEYGSKVIHYVYEFWE